MEISVLKIIFWILLVDSIGANIVSWTGNKWYRENFKLISRWFPPAKGWTILYLVLVLYIGYLVY